MRILIADDKVAGSRALRPFFRTGARSTRVRKLRGTRAGKATMGELIVSCPPRKAIKGPEDCSCAGIDLGDQPEQAASVFDALGLALLNRGCLKEGAALVQRALEIRLKFFGPDHPLTALSRNSTARAQRELGELDSAFAAVSDAIRINTKAYGPHSLAIAINLVELGICQLQQGSFGAALQSARNGLCILTTLGLYDTDPNTTRLLDIRGRAELNLDQVQEAAATYKELLPLDLRQLGTRNHPKYATHLANEAGVKEALRKIAAAEQGYRTAIDLYEKSLDRPCHPNLIDACSALGSLLRIRNGSGDLAEAGELFDRALRLDVQIRGPGHYFTGNDHADLGRYYYDSDQRSSALSEFQQALDIYDKNVQTGALPANHIFIAESQTWKGRILIESGEADAGSAESILENAVQIWPTQLGPDTVGGAIAKACLGRSLFLQHKSLPRARQLLLEAYPIVLRALGVNHAFTQQVLQWLAELGINPAKKRAMA
ncbi:tetratricopeptide repeat protein [Povalibacter sp.]|uniref:tetratricopeptide repeat protein n=1 Tax=Povalibacter sp. TaxID=1962978 RepID=UPI002F405373